MRAAAEVQGTAAAERRGAAAGEVATEFRFKEVTGESALDKTGLHVVSRRENGIALLRILRGVGCGGHSAEHRVGEESVDASGLDGSIELVVALAIGGGAGDLSIRRLAVLVELLKQEHGDADHGVLGMIHDGDRKSTRLN